MLHIRCPYCEHMESLQIADWEDYLGILALGEHTRIGLICLTCGREFLLSVVLTEVIRAD
jgi:DNA-directed RNA polymerase subunit RPC12/RpoP